MLRGRLVNLLWIFIEKGGLIILSFATFYFFALFLSPGEYGEAIFALAIAEFLGMFLCSMWNDPLVRTKYDLNTAYSSIFWLGGSLTLCLVLILLVVIFIIAGTDLLFILIAVASIKVLASVLARPFVAQMRRDKNFKRLALRTLFGKLLGALVGILMVIQGIGPLAVIMQLVVMEVFSLVTLMYGNRHYITSKPVLSIFINISKEGIAVAVRQVLTNSLVKGIIIVLGVTTSKSAVGYFAFAYKIIELPYSAFVMGLRSYAVPVFASRANELGTLSAFLLKLTIATSFILVPMFIGAAVLAPPAISWLFDSKWDEAIFLFQIVVLLMGIRLFVLYHSICMIALGKASIGVIYEICNAVTTIVVVYFFAPSFGVLAAVYALGINVFLDFIIKVICLSKVIDAKVLEHLKACSVIMLSGTLMFLTLILSGEMVSNIILSSVISFLLGLLIYVLTLLLFKMNLKKSVINALKN